MFGVVDAIRVENLWFKYIGSDEWVLKDISFGVREGETVVIMGPSGCGKSTLLYVLVGMIPHIIRGEIRGHVSLMGLDVLRSRPEELTRLVGLVFQNPEIQVIMPSVVEEIAFGLENLNLSTSEIDKRIREILELTGLVHKMHESPYSLSLGEKQVLAIASVLALKPRILVLDEPTSMLDHPGTRRILELIEKIKRETSMTLVVVEHRIEWVAEHADRILIMEDGKIACEGAPSEIFSDKDLVVKTGVRPPQVSEIFYRILDSKPGSFPKIPVALREAVESLKANPKLKSAHTVVAPTTLKEGSVEDFAKGRVVIEVRDLWFRYGRGLPWILRGVNLEVREGEFLAIIGHSGAGKTTLVKHFNGLLKPVNGYVKILGYDTRKTSVSTLARIVGMVFQNPEAQFFASTIYDEMSFALRKIGLSKEEVEGRIKEALEAVDLQKPLQMSPHLLSFGEKHRLAIASILALRPKVIVLDEPFSGLDYKRSLQLLLVLKKFTKLGGTVVLVAHDLQLIGEVADRVVVLSGGKIAREGTTREVLSDVEWLAEHGFIPLQSTLLARELGIVGAVKTGEVAEAIVQLLNPQFPA
ncbi:MAG: energy-coupling factor transporter ATPase [Desulfurococcaceae archaeon]